jgi:hypothetical protein
VAAEAPLSAATPHGRIDMIDNNGPALRRRQVASIINDVLRKMEKYGETARNEMAHELEDLKETIQKCCNQVESAHPEAVGAEDKKKIYWLLGELEKRLNGPARNFIAPHKPQNTNLTELDAMIKNFSDNKGE